jgi:branched-chain amino acid transport system ATP-binding protein
MLEIESLSVSFGGLRALQDVSLRVGDGQFVAVVGANGAGKSTLFKAISGTVVPSGGRIRYSGSDLGRVRPARRAHLGIAHVPEGRQVFASMTVLENIEMGAYCEEGQRHFKETLAWIYELFPILADRRSQLAGTLSGGQQQMVAIARGLAARPRLLMLDEPSMGLAPTVVDTIFEKLSLIHREQRLAILLVEQRAAEALELCSHGYVLETGRVAFQGPRDALLASDHISNAYLGLSAEPQETRV